MPRPRRWRWTPARGTSSAASRRKRTGMGESGFGDQAQRDRLFHLSLDMLCVAGFDGYFRQINPAWSRTLGWTEAELLAFSWKDLVHPDDRRASREAGIAL